MCCGNEGSLLQIVNKLHVPYWKLLVKVLHLIFCIRVNVIGGLEVVGFSAG
jgi:hypothetical protein